MNKVYAILLVLLFTCIARAQNDAIPPLLVSGYENDYWVARVSSESVGAQKTAFITYIIHRTDPVAGYWEQYASIQLRAKQLIGFSGGLALLDDKGQWKLFRAKNVAIDGKPLPSGYKIESFASDGQLLYAYATPDLAPSTEPASQPANPVVVAPAIFALQGNDWKYLYPAPSAADPSRTAIASVRGRSFFACLEANTVRVSRLDSPDAKALAIPTSAGRIKFLSNVSIPLLAVQDTTGQWQVYDLDHPDQSPRMIESLVTSDLAIVGSTLRLVIADKFANFTQVSYFDYGRGKSTGPDAIGQLPLPEEVHNVWRQLVIMVMLTILTMMVMRKKDASAPIPLEKRGLVLAPVGRRLAAGLIDLFPIVITIYLLFRNRDNDYSFRSHDEFVHAGLLIFISILVYIAHTTISELIFKRTLGKWLFKMHVVKVDGSDADLSSLFVRNLLRVIDIGLLLPWLLMLYPPMQMRLGDMAAKTVVVMHKVDAEERIDDSEENN